MQRGRKSSAEMEVRAVAWDSHLSVTGTGGTNNSYDGRR